jgi:hypothetical protein
MSSLTRRMSRPRKTAKIVGSKVGQPLNVKARDLVARLAREAKRA